MVDEISKIPELKNPILIEGLPGIGNVGKIAVDFMIDELKAKQFLENMSLAFDKSTVVKEYKDEIETLQQSNDDLAKKVGNLIIEKDYLEGKLVSLASSKERKVLVDTKHNLSLNTQCKLLNNCLALNNKIKTHPQK
jgi:putative transposase